MRTTVIEFMGTTKAGKTSVIRGISDILRQKSIDFTVIDEAGKRLPQIVPDKSHEKDLWITLRQILDFLEVSCLENTVILLDRGFFDACFWQNLLVRQGKKTQEEKMCFLNILSCIHEQIGLKPDFVFSFDVSEKESLNRKYKDTGNIDVFSKHNCLSSFKDELALFYESIDVPKKWVDTTELSLSEVQKFVWKEIEKIISR